MPGALTPSRPVFYDAETYNGVADLGTLHRKFIQWVRWTYARDGLYKPCDARAADASDATGAKGKIASFYVPQPATPAQKLDLWAYVDLAGDATRYVDLLLTSQRGAVHSLRVDSAALGGGGATAGWCSFSFPCAPDSIVEVVATVSQADVRVQSLCGWWAPLASGSGITIATGVPAFISRTWAAQDRPDSLYFLRHLAKEMNRYAADRPRMVVASYFPGSADSPWGTSPTHAPGTWEVGRFKLFVSTNVSTLKVTVGTLPATTVPGELVYKAYEDGVLVATWNSSSAAGGVSTTADISVTKGSARVIELRVTATTAAGTRSAWVGRVMQRPPASADLGLAAGDTVPAAFPTLDSNAGRGGAPIMASGQSGRAGILDALLWLHANRNRELVGQGIPGPMVTRLHEIDQGTDFYGGALSFGDVTLRAAIRLKMAGAFPGTIYWDAVTTEDVNGTTAISPAFPQWVTRKPVGADRVGLVWSVAVEWMTCSVEGTLTAP